MTGRAVYEEGVMRGMAGRLCPGRERKPLEPYGVLAPFLRMVAWALTFLSALVLLAGLVAVELGWHVVGAPVVVIVGTAPAVAFALRWFAGVARPAPIAPVARAGGQSS